jgi:signal transduction histidine kinase
MTAFTPHSHFIDGHPGYATRGTLTFSPILDSDGHVTDFEVTNIDASTPFLWPYSTNEIVGSSLHNLFDDADIPFLKDQFRLVLAYNRKLNFTLNNQKTTVAGNLPVSFHLSSANNRVIAAFTLTDTFQSNKNGHIDQTSVLQQVIDNTQAGLVFARPLRDGNGVIIDFQYILTNNYNARVTGKSVAEMTGNAVGTVFPGWQASDLFDRFVQVIKTETTQHLTLPYEDYDMRGWYDGTFCCIDGCILYTYIDVTSLKEAEVIQQQQAALLKQVMDTTPTSIVVHESVRDTSGMIIDFRMTQLNQVAADLLGYPIQAIQYRRISRFFPGLLDTPLYEQYKEVVRTGVPTRMDVPWGDQWFDFSVARFGDGIVVAVQDVTAMHTYRNQLEQANRELKRSNENLESFAYVASHDLQEPLRKLSSFTDILHKQYAGQFDVDATDIIARINTSAVRMRLLVRDLLAYARIGSQKIPFEAVDLNTLFAELQNDELWAVLYQSKAIVNVDSLITLVADPIQMRQLFQNLLTNAVKFCPKNTTPVVSVSGKEVAFADIATLSVGSNAAQLFQSVEEKFYEISIQDNGIGFDERYLDRIFQVFQRLHGRNRYEGSGIGLAICQKIVEQHGGFISANSKPGIGSTFKVYLPFRTLM